MSRAFPAAVKELRFLFCQHAQASAGARQYIVNHYAAVKKANPDVPLLVREASGTPARVFARFERGVERHVEVDGLSEQEVDKAVSSLVAS
ncbi:NADH dehydrogenase, alpha subcomplex, subunit 2 [Exidia glandulosa HHB12029]|uniref:NADH dehydrogenase, alpha subcomplex, subunit 2 n=1 Tax=Exidia glandulosa HHB12029 TaxID=1314781 RepID=A0A165ES87_EXIGL|nr:NADH dehydrogenase, alpha subcomplex, subunit 2 [Exidia glandulosa HHB12029]KZV87565.1 NADH dehydrogenase, alpha subcomplex, subunit 2 [Exidia glandulosa HHB12029]